MYSESDVIRNNIEYRLRTSCCCPPLPEKLIWIVVRTPPYVSVKLCRLSRKRISKDGASSAGSRRFTPPSPEVGVLPSASVVVSTSQPQSARAETTLPRVALNTHMCTVDVRSLRSITIQACIPAIEILAFRCKKGLMLMLHTMRRSDWSMLNLSCLAIGFARFFCRY